MSWRDEETESFEDVVGDDPDLEPVEVVEEPEEAAPAPEPGAPVVYRRGPGGSLIPG